MVLPGMFNRTASNAGDAGYTGFGLSNSSVTDGSGDYWSRSYTTGNRKTNTFHMGFRVLEPGHRSTLISAGSASNGHYLELENSGFSTAKTNSGSSLNLNTASGKLFRDPGSFYAVTIRYDTTQATDSDRVKVWVNGVEMTWSATTSWPGLNDDMNWSNGVTHYLGTRYGGTNDAKLQFAYFIHQEGIAGDHLTVGEFYNGTTQYRLIDFSGVSVGTEGCILDFTNASDLGEDQSGSNDWTESGAPTQSSDSPTKNFCTWNAIDHYLGGHGLESGNLVSNPSSLSTNRRLLGTIGVKSGKWYFETTIDGAASTVYVGVASIKCYGASGTPNNEHALYRSNGEKRLDSTNTSYGATFTASDVIGIAFDMDSDTIEFYKNNSSQGAISYTFDDAEEYFPFAVINNAADGLTADFGQNDFTYTPPTGFKALSAANLPEVTITDPGEHFNTVLYTGNGTAIGSGGKAVSGVGFQPDLSWLKNRDQADTHHLYDAVRGATKVIYSSATNAEDTLTEGLTSFDSDGFTLGSFAQINTNSEDFVSWNWLAGNGTSSNTDGSITSTVSVNEDAGFSIVTYTGTGSAGTVGHGQSEPPEMIIVKRLSNTADWQVYHHGIASDAETDYLELSTTGAAADNSNRWNDVAPTSSAFTVSTTNAVNASTDDMIAYCFRSIPGYSKVFSYTGNGSTDGVFIWWGMKPRWVLIKKSSASESWIIYDAVRDEYNRTANYLFADSNIAEGISAVGDVDIDILSNGIKLRGNGSNTNTSSQNFIGIAFAENPFGGSNVPLGLAV